MPPVRALFLYSLLAGIVVSLAAGLFFRYGIAPHQQRQTDSVREIGDLRKRLRTAQVELWQIKEQEQETARLRTTLNALFENVPVGPSVAWFPVRMKAHLSNFGVAEASIRLNSTMPEPRLRGFERSFWHVSMPQQAGIRKMNDALLAVAQIEQDQFVKILDFSLHSETEESSWTVGQVNLMTFVRK